jgi:hypothetical protein
MGLIHFANSTDFFCENRPSTSHSTDEHFEVAEGVLTKVVYFLSSAIVYLEGYHSKSSLKRRKVCKITVSSTPPTKNKNMNATVIHAVRMTDRLLVAFSLEQ